LNIEFIKAKNQEDSFKINSVFYHSSYTPSKEAQRFTEGLDFPFAPKILLVIEPGLSYVKTFLKEKFPKAKICALRFIKELKNNGNWDLELDATEPSKIKNIFSNFTEEELLNTQIVTWPAAQNIFSKEIKEVWSSYKEAFEYSKTVLITRQYFEKKWLINSVNFFKNLNKITLLNKVNVPVVITASGPSLKNAIKIIKNNQHKIIVVALSSSLSVLLKNDIIPDLCLTTDGGFWALKHLKKLHKYSTIPVAMSSEAVLYKDLYDKNPIIPLDYKDGLSAKLFSYTGLSSQKAERNGTVSGTALELFLNYTDKIYFCGLDLATSKGYSHTQPNELEIENSCFDNRLSTKEKRISGGFNAALSLKIYEDWFKRKKLNKKVFRVIENKEIKNELGDIKDIEPSLFEKNLSKQTKEKSLITGEEKVLSSEEKKSICKKMLQFIDEKSGTDEWKNQLFPMDYILKDHAKNTEEKTLLEKKIKEKNDRIIEKIKALLDAE
jgi:hypothetical protein